MDNREFAQVLLYEATELLNEAGARHKYAKILQDKETKLKKMIDQSYGEKREDLEEELANVQEELRDKCGGAIKGGYNSKTPINYMKPKYYGRYVNSKKTSTTDGKTYTCTCPSDQPYLIVGGALAKSRFNDAFKGKESSNLHKRITERGKKSQNESVAILLTEAALLLNE